MPHVSDIGFGGERVARVEAGAVHADNAILQAERVEDFGHRAADGDDTFCRGLVGIGGLIGHIAGGVDWGALAAGCVGAVPGAYLGAQLTGRLDDRQLLRAIAAILVVAGIALGVEAVIG